MGCGRQRDGWTETQERVTRDESVASPRKVFKNAVTGPNLHLHLKVYHILNSLFSLEYVSLANFMKFILKKSLFFFFCRPQKMKTKGTSLLCEVRS